jgi:Kdo2-lipid IVA lauroyltransferase/acyltransferase
MASKEKGKVQVWVEYAAVAALFRLVGLLPLGAAVVVAQSIASIAYPFLGRLRRVGLKNLEIAFPEKTPAERKALLKKALKNMARVFAYFTRFDRLNYEMMRSLVEYDPDPAFAASLEKVVSDGRGRIILTGHTGNWELQALCYPLFFGPLSFLARRMDNPRIDAMVKRIRTRLGNRQIDKENSAGAILRLMRAGGSVGALADVNAHPNEGIFVPFFGIPASTSTGIAMLAQRSGAVIVPMLAVWDEQKGKYKIVYRDIIEPDETADRKSDIERMTAACAAATESLIREFPDQYIWIHRRWKTRPPGEPELY